jgi:2-polyprenyl-3-methyl-5-hydroxy-6-metoxy-1,4-benzoquinol methylase
MEGSIKRGWYFEMNSSAREDYKHLGSQYDDPRSLMYRKLRLVDSFVEGGDKLLDVGVGTGEWIDLEKDKFKVIYGLDVDTDSIDICRKKFLGRKNIHLINCDLRSLNNSFDIGDFDYITCLDVLEHIPESAVREVLHCIYSLMRPDGRLIFTGPGIFEKARIALGRSPTHLHSHSSYGWQSLLRKAGFEIIWTESVEFPVIHSDVLRKQAHLFGKCCVIVAEKTHGGA